MEVCPRLDERPQKHSGFGNPHVAVDAPCQRDCCQQNVCPSGLAEHADVFDVSGIKKRHSYRFPFEADLFHVRNQAHGQGNAQGDGPVASECGQQDEGQAQQKIFFCEECACVPAGKKMLQKRLVFSSLMVAADCQQA